MDQIMRYRKYLEELQKSEKEGEPAVSTPQSILERLKQLKNQEFVMRVPMVEQDGQ